MTDHWQEQQKIIREAVEWAARSNHHPDCTWGKTGSGLNCRCHVGATKAAIRHVAPGPPPLPERYRAALEELVGYAETTVLDGDETPAALEEAQDVMVLIGAEIDGRADAEAPALPVIADLQAALGSCVHQIEQMQKNFDDEDGEIEKTLAEAAAALAGEVPGSRAIS